MVARARSWGLEFAAHKCIRLRFARPFADLPPPLPLTINGTPILLQNSARDLGVEIDTSLRFHKHVTLTKSKAFGVSQNLLHATVCRSPDFMKQIYISHVRPIMDFCSSVWNTGFVGDSKALESVQRRWTKEINGFSEIPYYDRLRRLSLFSVWGRFLRADLILVWKIMHSTNPCLTNILVRSNLHRTRGHSFKLAVIRTQTESRRRFFSNRVVSVWNNLPEYVVASDSLNIFKARLCDALGDLLYYYHDQSSNTI